MKMRRSLLWLIPAAAVIGLPVAMVAMETLWGGWRLVHEPLHTAMETLGGLTTLAMVMFLLLMKREVYGGKLFLLALGLINMGLLDVFHAISAPGKGFVLLRSAASLAGGFWFVLIYLPWCASDREAAWRRWMPWVVMTGSIFIGIYTPAARETLPVMLREGRFTPTAIAINILASAFFLAAAARLLLDFHRLDRPEIYLFACMATLFGLAGLMFPFSSVWDSTWWLWHVLRLAASLLALVFVIYEYQRVVSDLRIALAERKQAEETMARRAQALARSNADLEQFAYVASHDLQEPLRMVASFTQLLAKRYRGRLDTDADEFIEYAVDGASRMQRLINDLLAYSRLSTRGNPFEPTDTEDALTQALANLRAAVEESGAEVTHDPLPTVTADGQQLVQVFQNLLNNAIKFRGEAPPRIQVSTERKGDGWIFSFRDNGIGIDPEYHERIFAIFQRLHNTAEYPGTGIGLAICRRTVERHGGRIWVASKPGQGSTFYFTIPTGGGECHGCSDGRQAD